MAMIIFTIYASFLVLSATIYEGPFFTFLRSLAIGFLAADVVLLALLYHSRNLVLVTWLFLALVDSGTITICFNFCLVSQYIMWLLFIPILLFFIVGRQAGSWGLVLILIQLTVFVPLSTYVFTTGQRAAPCASHPRMVRVNDDVHDRRRHGLRARRLTAPGF
jgi:hypothetical protein